MDWQSRLIAVYLKVCDLWDQGIWTACQRFSNNQRLIVTDEEILSIYIYGIMEGHKTVKSIHSFTSAFLVEWLPQLGAYEAFNHRLTQISDVFAAMLEKLIDASDNEIHFPNFRLLMDSFPIVMANARRSSSAKVAPEVADKGYCDSKKMFYYGVKLHVAGHDRNSTLPKPSIIGLTPASHHDLTAFRQVAPQLDHCEIFSDKAYADHLLQKELRENQNVIVATPINRKKGQNLLDS